MSSSARRLFPGSFPLPLDLDAVYGRRGALVLEIGFGNGTFLSEMARLHPEWNFLGVEIAGASITRGVRLLRRENLEHARMFCGDGRFVVREMIAPGQLYRAYLNFPDPWPKEKHLEKRLLRAPFFRLLSTRLDRQEGQFWFTSDHEEYFEFGITEAESTGLFAVHRGDPPPEALRTKYARRWQRERKRIHHAVFVPLRADPDPHPPRLEFIAMAHARMSGDLDQVSNFEKQIREVEGAHVVILDAARSLDGQRLIFHSIVEEADLRQDLVIEARPTGRGMVYVELKGHGVPATTRAVQAAVDLVAEWLATRGLEKVEDGRS